MSRTRVHHCAPSTHVTFGMSRRVKKERERERKGVIPRSRRERLERREARDRRERENEPSLTNVGQGENFQKRVTAWDFSRRASCPSATYDLDFLVFTGCNAGRWSPRAAPFYLVTITLGCMKCATGIQPSPHNSPIYDWAKLLSMRRIKSRARVQEKSAGRRDGRPRRRSPRSRVAAPRRPCRRRNVNGPSCAATRSCSRAGLHDASPFSVDFSPRFPRAADKFAEKLNAVRHDRGAAMADRLGQSPSTVSSSSGKRRDESWRDVTARLARLRE